VKAYETRIVEELKLIKEDLYGRLDYHLINLLFKVQQEDQKNQPESDKNAK
jgi:hypothetical protein